MESQTPETGQVRQVLQRFQDGYTARDVSHLDEFMQLFVDSPELEVIGTNGSRPGMEEWHLGLAGARELVKGDWEGWGDLVLDVAGANIHVHGEVAWLAAPATVHEVIRAEENYQNYLEFIKSYIDREGLTAETKLHSILRGGTNTIFELNRGEDFTWALRFTAVLVKQAGEWKFHQMQFSFPTIYFPDVRIL